MGGYALFSDQGSSSVTFITQGFLGEGGNLKGVHVVPKAMCAFFSLRGLWVGRTASPPPDWDSSICPIRRGGQCAPQEDSLTSAIRPCRWGEHPAQPPLGPLVLPPPPHSPLSSSCRTTGKLAWDTE